jgi:uncharacterized protein (DUF433 family)
MADVIRKHIEIVQGAGGPKARIAGHRIRVQDVAFWNVKLGLSPDEIVVQYPELTLADVHAALAYYWDNREEIERRIAEETAEYDEQRRRLAGPLMEKLKRLHESDPVPAGRAHSSGSC